VPREFSEFAGTQPLKTSLRLPAVIAVIAVFAAAGEEPVSPTNYLEIVRNYADAMIARGRDTHGAEHSPLFAAALDRGTMKLGTAAQFGAIPGVREHDRSLGGANPMEDRELYAALYQLTELTGERTYADEADRALSFFFRRCQSPATGLMAWGEHLYWDFAKDQCSAHLLSRNQHDSHEISGEWPFWDRCYRLAPDACWEFALGQWDHQIADQATGDFSRHARWSKHGPRSGMDFPRYAGQLIVNWADAWARPENAGKERRGELIEAVRCLLRRMEENMTQADTGRLPAFRGAAYVWTDGNLELARCLGKAALLVADPEPAGRLQALASRLDEAFLTAPHTLDAGGGFAATLDAATGKPRSRDSNKPYTEPWATGYGHGTHAAVANLCWARHGQLDASRPEHAAAYRALIVAAADQYLAAEPPTDALHKPRAFADVIEFMLNAHILTGRRAYLERAHGIGRLGIRLFLDDGLPLPRASNRRAHYESITGGPAFMHALLRLHGTHGGRTASP
jgi:hypothetical protein